MADLRDQAEQLKNKFISWDFFLTVGVTLILYLVLPRMVPFGFALDLYLVGVSVLSMCIFYFIAFIAVISASSDEEFIHYLRTHQGFVSVFRTYQYTIVVLFVALIFTLVMYGLANFQKYLMPDVATHNRSYFLSFMFFFCYGILTVFEATLDSVSFLKLRVNFIAKKRIGESGQESPKATDRSRARKRRQA